MTFRLRSSAFGEGQTIPKKYTGDGDDVSPPLEWSAPPNETASLALICDDPDAPRQTWVHWVLFNIPAELRSLAEGISSDGQAAGIGVQGKNDFDDLRYGGPAPPRGKPHRYFFKLYALDAHLDLREGATKEELLAAMQGHVLGEAQTMGTYQR
ncbi:MAG: YbhB/YbcL family Raf kinase inhibitor-like protein [Gemmataceae bacterium]